MVAALIPILIAIAEKILPAIAAAWLAKKLAPAPAPPVNPVDDALGKVRAATEAEKKVDPSAKAIAHDPNNLGPAG